VACSHWLSNVTEWCSLGGFGFHPEYVGRPHPVVVSIGQQQRGSERRKGGEREGSRRGVGRREDREAPATASVAVLLDGGVQNQQGKEGGSIAEEERREMVSTRTQGTRLGGGAARRRRPRGSRHPRRAAARARRGGVGKQRRSKDAPVRAEHRAAAPARLRRCWAVRRRRGVRLQRGGVPAAVGWQGRAWRRLQRAEATATAGARLRGGRAARAAAFGSVATRAGAPCPSAGPCRGISELRASLTFPSRARAQLR